MNAITDRQRQATARFMLRVIATEQALGIHRPDAVAFKQRMETQATERSEASSSSPSPRGTEGRAS